MRNSEFKTIQHDDIVYVDGLKCYCSRITRRNEVDCFDFYKYGESNDSKNIIATVTLLNRVKISPEKYTCEDFKSDAPQFSLSNVVMKKIKLQSDKIKSVYKNLTKAKPPKKKPVKIPEYITNAKEVDVLYVNGVECVVDSNQYIRSKDAYPHDINISIYRGIIYGYVNYTNISNKPPKESIDFKSLVDGDILYVLGNRCYCQISPRTQNEHMTVLLYKEGAGNCSDPLATLTITNNGNVFTISPGVYIDDISSKRPGLLYYIKQIFKKKEVAVVDETISEVESLLNCRLS